MGLRLFLWAVSLCNKPQALPMLHWRHVAQCRPYPPVAEPNEAAVNRLHEVLHSSPRSSRGRKTSLASSCRREPITKRALSGERPFLRLERTLPASSSSLIHSSHRQWQPRSRCAALDAPSRAMPLPLSQSSCWRAPRWGLCLRP